MPLVENSYSERVSHTIDRKQGLQWENMLPYDTKLQCCNASNMLCWEILITIYYSVMLLYYNLAPQLQLCIQQGWYTITNIYIKRTWYFLKPISQEQEKRQVGLNRAILEFQVRVSLLDFINERMQSSSQLDHLTNFTK